MQKGLTKRLDYEKGRQRRKASQPDYRERFTREGDKFDTGGSKPQHLTLADAARGDFRKILVEDRMRAITFYRDKLRGSLLKVGKWNFRFKFDATQFAKENDLSLDQAKTLLPQIRTQAQQRLAMSLKRALEARLEVAEFPPDSAGRVR